MRVYQPRSTLNDKQIDILLALFKFRFATVELIATYQKVKDKTYTFRRLQRLESIGYIGSRVLPIGNLGQRQRVYFLQIKSRHVLMQKGLAATPINALYKNMEVGSDHIETCLIIFRFYLGLLQQHHDLNFYSKSELSGLTQFPKPLPDAYMQLGDNSYFIERIHILGPYFLSTLRRKLLRYINHYDSDEWEDNYPAILLVCDDGLYEKATQRSAKQLLTKAELEDDIVILTTTSKALLNQYGIDKAIWSDIFEPEQIKQLI